MLSFSDVYFKWSVHIIDAYTLTYSPELVQGLLEPRILAAVTGGG